MGMTWTLKNAALAAAGLAAAFAACPAVASAAGRFEEGAYANYKPDVKNGKSLFSAAGCGVC